MKDRLQGTWNVVRSDVYWISMEPVPLISRLCKEILAKDSTSRSTIDLSPRNVIGSGFWLCLLCRISLGSFFVKLTIPFHAHFLDSTVV